MDMDTNYRRQWRICEDSVEAIEFALNVNAENGEEVGFRLINTADGTMLEADTPGDALDAADYIEREIELIGECLATEWVAATVTDYMRHDIYQIRRVANFWRGGEA